MSEVLQSCLDILTCLNKEGALIPDEMPPDLVPFKGVIEEMKKELNSFPSDKRAVMLPITVLFILSHKNSVAEEEDEHTPG